MRSRRRGSQGALSLSRAPSRRCPAPACWTGTAPRRPGTAPPPPPPPSRRRSSGCRHPCAETLRRGTRRTRTTCPRRGCPGGCLRTGEGRARRGRAERWVRRGGFGGEVTAGGGGAWAGRRSHTGDARGQRGRTGGGGRAGAAGSAERGQGTAPGAGFGAGAGLRGWAAWAWAGGPVGTWPVVRPCPGRGEEELAQIRCPEEGVRIGGESELVSSGGLRERWGRGVRREATGRGVWGL